jgi:cytoskeleton protein RodZ
MPEIGETLREARMRAKIDVSEVEAATKIRAKYLRALENEEWGLLPGATFVRSFLRTYADYLGLDSKLLVEEFRLSHEGPSELDLAPIAPNLGPERVRLPAPRLSRGWIVGLALAGLLVLLIVLGSLGGGKSGDSGKVATQRSTANRKGSSATPAVAPAPAAAPVTARLQLIATDPVYVCLVDSGGKRLIDGQIVDPGAPARTFTAKGFAVLFGHGPQAMRVNGRRIGVPASSNPIGYAITPTGRRALSQAKLPNCSQ